MGVYVWQLCIYPDKPGQGQEGRTPWRGLPYLLHGRTRNRIEQEQNRTAFSCVNPNNVRGGVEEPGVEKKTHSALLFIPCCLPKCLLLLETRQKTVETRQEWGDKVGGGCSMPIYRHEWGLRREGRFCCSHPWALGGWVFLQGLLRAHL